MKPTNNITTKSPYKEYPIEVIRKMVDMLKNDVKVPDIAKAVGRSEQSVVRQFNKLGYSLRGKMK